MTVGLSSQALGGSGGHEFFKFPGIASCVAILRHRFDFRKKFGYTLQWSGGGGAPPPI